MVETGDEVERATATAAAEPDDRVVPLRKQYLAIKARYPDTILFFRLGDFYETFDRDAEIASATLDIVLTGREMGRGIRVAMAGIPHHSAEGYIGRLIANGYKVALCEQVGEVTKGRGLVDRDVTRVITPGTVLDPSMLDSRTNNYIASAVWEGSRVGFAFADVSTGEFQTTELTLADAGEALLAVGRELLRLGPAEVVFPAGWGDNLPLASEAWLPPGITITPTDAWRWRLDRTSDQLCQHFAVDSLDGFGCGGRPLAIRAAGGLLHYLAETQISGLRQIASLTTYSVDRFMTLDAQTRRNLELTESARGDKRQSLVGVLDETRTPMGSRLLRRWLGQPLVDLGELGVRLDAVERYVTDAIGRGDLRATLGTVHDIERIINRAITGISTPRDLGVLRETLKALPALLPYAGSTPGASHWPSTEPVHDLLQRAIADDVPVTLAKGGTIRAGFAPELDGLRVRAREARDYIANLERTERDRTGLRALKVGYNRVFGYYLEISAATLANAERDRGGSVLPADYVPKQTLANATRYVTAQLKEYETIVLTAEETLTSLEADVFKRVVAEVAGQASGLLQAAQTIAYLDVVSGFGEVAVRRNYVRPQLDDSGTIDISEGRHPTIEALLGPGEFVPNDALLDLDQTQIVVLTGPNMAGKSSWLRQVALIVLLGQIGSFVPAKSARIGLVDRIFTRIGAQDDLASGQSTFMVEMLETANILNHATERSLVILDEIGRGTSTYDGLAIARSIVEYIHNASRLGCKTLFATHYHEMTELERVLPRVRNFRVDVLEDGDRVVFLRQVVPGGADKSYGIHVAQLAGLPKPVIRRAREILDDLEGSTTRDSQQERRMRAMRSEAEPAPAALQMTLFAAPNPVIAALKSVDVESLSPLEAINKLFELRKMVDD